MRRSSEPECADVVAELANDRRPEASEAGDEAAAPLLSVLVPVYNEAPTVNELLRRVTSVPLDIEVIIVDDGSTDGTPMILERWEGHPLVALLAHARNRGKGAAIRTGLEHANGKFTVVQDADLEYDPGDFPRLVAPLLAGQADVVYGSRYLASQRARLAQAKRTAGGAHATTGGAAGAASRVRWSLFRSGVRALNVAARCLYGARLTDEATCYKVFPTETLRAMRLECEGFEFCPEVTAKACRMGLTILEMPISYAPRSVGEGKKIRLRDGLGALAALWRWRHWEAGVDVARLSLAEEAELAAAAATHLPPRREDREELADVPRE